MIPAYRLILLLLLLGIGKAVFASITTTASRQDMGTQAVYTLDGNLAGTSRWSAHGYGQWIAYDFSRSQTITSGDIAFYRGTQRIAYFDIQVSNNRTDWRTILRSAMSNGKTGKLQRFEFADANVRYIRILGKGNSNDLWNSFTEVRWNTTGQSLPKPPTTIPITDPGTLPKPTTKWWQPVKGLSWQWQLNGNLNTGYSAQVYSLDLEDNSASVISELKQTGKKIVCYFSAGSYENWRLDQAQFKASDLGAALDGWPGERWLDIRSQNVRAIMVKRLQLAQKKGCHAVEPDNIDGYANKNGLSLTYAHQLDYNRFLATQAHQLGLGIALKNNLDQIPDLVTLFDFAINEECHAYQECDALLPFIKLNKPVFNAEYAERFVSDQSTREAMCRKSRQLGIHTLVLPVDLNDEFRIDCGKP